MMLKAAMMFKLKGANTCSRMLRLTTTMSNTTQMRCFSSRDDSNDGTSAAYAGRSSLFGKDSYLEAAKRRMKREYHEDDRFEPNEAARQVKDRVGEQRTPVFRAEMVYSADVQSVLDMFRKQLASDTGSLGVQNYAFYYACLDRIDILMTEKNSQVQKSQILSIVSALAYFRPKKSQRASKEAAAYGDYSATP